MLTTMDLIGVLGLCASCIALGFTLGFSIGSSTGTKK